MDQNSYDSGDWFNKIDWTGQGNNWGIGLPIASQNASQWPFEQPLLANAALKPTPAEIGSTTAAFQEFLKIRGSSSLFRMATAAEVEEPSPLPQHRSSTDPWPHRDGARRHPRRAPSTRYNFSHIVVVFNATNAPQSFTSASLAGLSLGLHPIQQESNDPVVRTSTFEPKSGTALVPALTTAVFVSSE